MKYIKTFESINRSIEEACEKYDIGRFGSYEIKDGLVNVDGDVSFMGFRFSKIPIKFGRVEGGFFLPNEYCIKTLEGSPKWVGGSFVCQNGLYTNLKGAPEYVGGDFRSADNRNLISLEGAPNKIVGDFNIKYTNIRNFYGIKEFSLGGSYFECLGSPIYYIYTLFYDPRCIDSINEYGAIQGDNIIWDRLVEVYHDLEMNPPDPYEFDVDVLESISTIDHISKGGYKLIF